MLRYKLRTLSLLLAILPPLLAVSWWKYSAWKAEQARLKALRALQEQVQQLGPGILLIGGMKSPTSQLVAPSASPPPVTVPEGP